jgi:hypothetical protein
VRKTIGADLLRRLIGVPAGFERVLTTRPYYRSATCSCTAPTREPLARSTIRAGALRDRRAAVGDDLAATPPGLRSRAHGAVEHVVGYPVCGDGSGRRADQRRPRRRPPRRRARLGAAGRLVRRRSAVPLALRGASAADVPLPFDFAIAMGVRSGDRRCATRSTARSSARAEIARSSTPTACRAAARRRARAAAGAGARP